MPYSPSTWTDGTTPLNATRMSNLETQYTEATQSYEAHLLTPFFLFTSLPTKDGTNANQLDVAGQTVFLKQTSDSTLRKRAFASTHFTTSTPSTTYYLYANEDGTYTWSTTNAGSTANALSVVSVTTDGSGNILAITDLRQQNTTLLSGMSGTLALPGNISIGGNITALSNVTFTGSPLISSRQSGAATGLAMKAWNGSAGVVPFSVGGQFASALSWVDSSGNFNGPVACGVPVTRAGVASSVPIYTSTTTPSSPPTGSIWIKARYRNPFAAILGLERSFGQSPCSPRTLTQASRLLADEGLSDLTGVW